MFSEDLGRVADLSVSVSQAHHHQVDLCLHTLLVDATFLNFDNVVAPGAIR